jgi:phage shock protein PspC (stress-responsive transcriptional regulator)
MKKLLRSDDQIIGGVCAGIGEYLNIDATIVRVAFAGLLFFAGVGLLSYVLLWIIIPEK